MRKTMKWIFLVALLLTMCGCGTPKSGLQAEYPPPERDLFSLFGTYVEADSLTPTLRWQTVGQVFMEGNERKIDRHALADITYEVRIWKTETGYAGKRVYSRRGIRTPYHTLEEPLEPDSRYLWTVRAHFLVDGKPRVSEWGMTGFLLQDEPVPDPACFRFKTGSK